MSPRFFYALFLSTLLNLNIFGMEQDIKIDSDSAPTQDEIFAVLKQKWNTPRAENNSNINLGEESNVKEFRYLLSKSDKIIFEKALKHAPEKVKSIIEREKNLDPEITSRLNYLFFVGEPGTGKSTLAKAVGCELGICYFIKLGDLLSKHRHATSQRLNKIIKTIMKAPGKAVIVIDEMNKLFENYMNENNDSGDTSIILWQIIDANKLNPNIFWIGTGNESKKMPPQLQHRFRHRFVEVLSFALRDCRKELIFYYLHSFKTPIDALDINKNIEQLVDRTINFTPRDIESLCDAAVNFAYNKKRNGKALVLTLECLEEAFKDRKNDDSKYVNFSTAMTDEEKRHKESMNQGRLLFEENKELQLKTAELNSCIQTHFVTLNLLNSPGNSYNKFLKDSTWEGIRSYHKKLFPERNQLPSNLADDSIGKH